MTGKTTGLLAVAGCAAGCAAVALVPALLGGAAAGGALAALHGEAGLAVVVALVASAAYLWQRRREAKCGCAPDAGCTATTCARPAAKEPE